MEEFFSSIKQRLNDIEEFLSSSDLYSVIEKGLYNATDTNL